MFNQEKQTISGIRAMIWCRANWFTLAVGIMSGVLINLALSANQGAALNRLDEIVLGMNADEFPASLLTFISARLGSPHAELNRAEQLLSDGDSKAAYDLLFDATWKAPTLGLQAGKMALEYATTDDDVGHASSYLTRAAMLSDNAEADLLLGYIALGIQHKVKCSTWKQALHWFRKSAQQGNGTGQLITAYAYGLGRGIKQSRRISLGYLLIAEDNANQHITALAKEKLDRFAVFILPNEKELRTTAWDPFPSAMQYSNWLAEILNEGMPDFDIFKAANPQSLPGFCPSEDIKDDCDPYKEAC